MSVLAWRGEPMLPLTDDSNVYKKKINEMGGILMSEGSEPEVVC